MKPQGIKTGPLAASSARARRSTNGVAVFALSLMFVFMPLVQARPGSSSGQPAWSGGGDDFGSVVKMIERFYHVKHQGIPLLARAGMKTATTIARIKGGTAKRLAEAGSIKIAIFEDQEFNSNGSFGKFRSTMNAALSETWMPFVQTLSAKDEEQTYIFLRNTGEKFNVLVVTIERRQGTVVQVTVSPRNLALLMQDPNGMGRAITEDATTTDPE